MHPAAEIVTTVIPRKCKVILPSSRILHPTVVNRQSPSQILNSINRHSIITVALHCCTPPQKDVALLTLATTEAPSKSLLLLAINVASPQNISSCGIVGGRISITPPIASEP